MKSDPYRHLRPAQPTAAEDLCACVEPYPFKLMFALSYNPVCCMACNREVRPEIYRPDESLCEAIACWRELYRAAYVLWLDSADYEDWGRAQLVNMSSRVNRLGLDVRARVNVLRRTYYWLFDGSGLTACPLCSQALEESPLGIFRQVTCEPCSIVASGDPSTTE